MASTIARIGIREASILHIDDNRAAQAIMRRALLGANVCSISGTQDAIELLMQQEFDLVITDFNLGDSDGLEIIDAVRSSNRQTPILVVSNSMDEALKGRVLRMGANMAISKPMDHEIMRSLVNELLAHPLKKAPEGDVIGTKCFSWIRSGVFYLFSPDCEVTTHGQSADEALRSMAEIMTARRTDVGKIRAEKLIDLPVPLST